MQKNRLPYLDGLRGIAALLVFMIHAGGWGLRELGSIGNSIADHGKYGVTIFFVVSAYSLCLSIQSSAVMNLRFWAGFYVRRLFRIMPLYLLALAVYIQLGGGVDYFGIDSIISHVFLLNIFMPWYANDIISVEWSIAVEMAFYLVFPLFYVISQRRLDFIFIFIVLFSLYPIRDLVYMSIGDNYFKYRAYTLFWYLHIFLLGIVAYTLKLQTDWGKLVSSYADPAIAALLIALLVLGESNLSVLAFGAITFLVLMRCRTDCLLRRILSGRLIVFAGGISFSIYLWHILGIRLFGPFWAVPATIGLSYLTYRFVERPFMKLGRKLGSRLEGEPRAIA
ncbi:acyltransferase family protein [Pannonibacter sp. Q-1]